MSAGVLDGRRILVTGGAGGIGTAICRKFHDAGYRVVAGCGPTRDHAKWLAEQKDAGFTTGAEFSCNGGLHMG